MLKCNFNEVALKSRFGMGVLKHLFLRTPLEGCFWRLILCREKSYDVDKMF